jgi:hypothetical protein
MADPDRAAAARAFVRAAGWEGAAWTPLAGDASARRYVRLSRGTDTAILMDAPPGGADRVEDVLTIGDHLIGLGLSAPRLLAVAPAEGFLLQEDLGDALFARLIAADPAREAALMVAAARVLAHLQAHPAPPGLPDLGAADWAAAADLAATVYAPAATGAPPPPAAALRTPLAEALATHADGPRVLILRDYHAENLLWLHDRPGLAQVGLLDFQLGQMGQPGYDLVSLVQDARRDVGAEAARAALRAHAEASGRPAAAHQAALAVLGAQRALRILGIFARLASAGKPAYVGLIPRVWGHLQTNLAHPALAPLAAAVARHLPAPTPQALTRIRQTCPPTCP